MVASELDGPIEPTAEYERSLTESKNDEVTNTRKINTTGDASSFMLNIQMERSGAGYCFDGVDTDGQNVCIQLKGDSMYTDENDTYYNYQVAINTIPDPADPTHLTIQEVITANPSPPEAWICRECYWEIDTSRGLKFKDFGQPPGSQTAY
jgi:hypothetical protein